MLRCRLKGLTLINWNGYFARTLTLDRRMTMLSGSNGAGKSTLLAALLVAWIPDLSLLHLRNTTEAGSSRSSRDRGLFGKLSAGPCYSLLQFQKQEGTQLLAGSWLQQRSAREGKVELKPFCIEGWPKDLDPALLFVRQVKAHDEAWQVVAWSELPARVASYGATWVKLKSVQEYHQHLFRAGLLFKPLRSQTERTKFYRILEASLYGGLPAAMAYTLKSYLLTEPLGVQRAFQELESAVQENRLTLLALQETERLRNLFQSLLRETRLYVTSEVMQISRRLRLDLSEIMTLRKRLADQKQWGVELQQRWHRALDQQKSAHQLQVNREAAWERWRLEQSGVERALQQMTRLAELHHKIGAQREACALSAARCTQEAKEVEQLHVEVTKLEAEVGHLKEALNTQEGWLREAERQWIHRREAEDRLRRAVAVAPEIASMDRSLERLEPWLNAQLKGIKTKLDAVEAAQLHQWTQLQNLTLFRSHREKAQRLHHQLQEAWPEEEKDDGGPKRSLRALWQGRLQRQKLNSEAWRQQAEEAEAASKLLKQRQAAASAHQHLMALWQGESWLDLTTLPLGEMSAHWRQRAQKLSDEGEQVQAALRDQQGVVKEQSAALQRLEPQRRRWLEARAALRACAQEVGVPLNDLEDFQSALTHMREKEREERAELQGLQHRHTRHTSSLEAASQATLDPEALLLEEIAHQLGGERLQKRLDHAPAAEALHLSALLDPFQHAILVPNLASAQEAFRAALPSIHRPFYLMEQAAFSETNQPEKWKIACEPGGLWVEGEADWMVRYTPYPAKAWVGAAAREAERLEAAAEAELLTAQIHQLERCVQQRRHRLDRLERLFAHHGALAFGEDLEVYHAQLNAQLQQKEAALQRLEALHQKHQAVWQRFMEGRNAIERLESMPSPLLERSEALCFETWATSHRQAVAAQEAAKWVERWRDPIEALLALPESTFEDSCASDQEHLDLQHGGERLKQEAQNLRSHRWIFEQLVERLEDLDRAPASKTSPSEALKKEGARIQVALQEGERALAERRQALEASQVRGRTSEQQRLKLEAKLETQRELEVELQDELVKLGSALDPALHPLSIDTLQAWCQLDQGRALKEAILEAQAHGAKQIQNVAQIEAQLHQNRDQSLAIVATYRLAREQFLVKQRGWIVSRRHMAQDRRLPELQDPERLSWSEEALRSEGDQALGRLRAFQAMPLPLRKALETSGRDRDLMGKIKFFQAVLNHLQEHIRQDLFQTQDPIQALESMEAELVRLREELSRRTSRLRISTQGVAQLIQKAIQREELRIKQLNQQLQQSRFGEIEAIRVKLSLRPTHGRLLEALLKVSSVDLLDASPEHGSENFFEKLGLLYSRLLPEESSVGHTHLQSRSALQMGEALLDYRNYLDLTLEVLRKGSGWMEAESGRLSTGEAIGTGMSMLMMVLQSWEEEGRRLRGPTHRPVRLLLLDEAARLDGRSIETLHELCEQLDLQLLMAAPEGLSLASGMTYQLKRQTRSDGMAHVDVIGITHQRESLLEIA